MAREKSDNDSNGNNVIRGQFGNRAISQELLALPA
jgi:hypothetical protein